MKPVIILIPKSDENITKKPQKPSEQLSVINTDAKILKKNYQTESDNTLKRLQTKTK